MFPPRDPNKPQSSAPNGYGILRNKRIYTVPIDSDLGREYEKLTSKEEKVQFLLTKGELRPGEVILDTRQRDCSRRQ
jgi:hypothetical protein